MSRRARFGRWGLAALFAAAWLPGCGEGSGAVPTAGGRDPTSAPTLRAAGRTETGAERASAGPSPSEAAVRLLAARVRFEDRTPAAGITVVATGPSGEQVSAVTGADGTAHLRVPWIGGRVAARRGGGHLHEQPLRVPGASGRGPDAEDGPTLTVSRRRLLFLRVRRRGEPFLPESYAIRVGGLPVESRELPSEPGRVAVAFEPPPTTERVALTFEPHSGPAVTVLLPAEDGNQGFDVPVEVEPARTPLDLRVLLPARLVERMPGAGAQPLFHHAGLDRWHPGEDRWAPTAP